MLGELEEMVTYRMERHQKEDAGCGQQDAGMEPGSLLATVFKRCLWVPSGACGSVYMLGLKYKVHANCALW